MNDEEFRDLCPKMNPDFANLTWFEAQIEFDNPKKWEDWELFKIAKILNCYAQNSSCLILAEGGKIKINNKWYIWNKNKKNIEVTRSE